MLKSLKIGTKLQAGFGLMILLLIIISGVGWFSLGKVSRSVADTILQSKVSNLANTAVDHANKAQATALEYMLNKDPAWITEVNNNLETSIKLAQEVRGLMVDPKNQKNAEVVVGTTQEYKKDFTEFCDLEKKVTDSFVRRNNIAGEIEGQITHLNQLAEAYIDNHSETIDGKKTVEYALIDVYHDLMICNVSLKQAIRLCREYINNDTVSGKEELAGKIVEQLELLKATIAKLEKETESEQITNIMKSVTEKSDAFVAELKMNLDYVSKQINLKNELETAVDKLLSVFKEVIEGVDAQVVQQGTTLSTLASTSNMVIMIVAVSAALGGLVLAYVLTRNITVGLTTIVKLMNKVAGEGDISITVDESLRTRKDEIGDLANVATLIVNDYQSVASMGNAVIAGDWTAEVKTKSDKDIMNRNLAAMLDQVNTVLGEVNSSVGQVATGANQVSSASESLSQGATESAASLEEITASMAEVGSQTQKNANNAKEASGLAKQASTTATGGQGMMRDMIQSMDQITKNSSDVQKVIKVIDDIAFQTNLLALNAAVEAARAGVHGKGFAVVAEEVRNLAARCAKAAGETSQMIDNSSRQIHEGAEIATKTADMLNEIVEHVAQTAGLVNEIATASNEQSQAVSQVAQALQQIDAVTQQNSANAEETASISREMSSQSDGLKRLVAGFKLRSAKSQQSKSNKVVPSKTRVEEHEMEFTSY